MKAHDLIQKQGVWEGLAGSAVINLYLLKAAQLMVQSRAIREKVKGLDDVAELVLSVVGVGWSLKVIHGYTHCLGGRHCIKELSFQAMDYLPVTNLGSLRR